MKKFAVAVVFTMAYAGCAMALEVSEIVNLIKSGVEDSVIINMVQSQKLPRPLTTSDVLTLNAGGASPALLEFLTRPENAVAAAPMVVPATPTVVTSTPAPSVTVVESAPTVVTTQPNVVVTSPPPVYYSPTYYYPYTSYPTYVPYRSYPRSSFNFGFSFGGGRNYRHHGRHGGGGRHHRRR
jgi:hypothetical protein